MKKKIYQKPEQSMVLLLHRTMLLNGSNNGYKVIGTDPPNTPAGVHRFKSGIDWDDELTPWPSAPVFRGRGALS